jgi:tetratricopeptide (TPR) repeat protein
MRCLQRAAQGLQATVDTLVSADETVVRNAHKLTAGLMPLSRCADVDALSSAVEPPLPHEAETVQQARLELARSDSLRLAGRFEKAKAAVEAAEALLANVDYGPVQTEVELEVGSVADKVGDYQESARRYTAALRSGARWKQRAEMAVAATQLMYVVSDQLGDNRRAYSYAKVARGLVQGDPLSEGEFENVYGMLLQNEGRHAEAEEHFEEGLRLRREGGARPMMIALSLHNLGNSLYSMGKYEDSETQHLAALEIVDAEVGADHPVASVIRGDLATTFVGQGRLEDAVESFEQALAGIEAAFGPSHPDRALMVNNLANVLHAQGKYEEAEAAHRQSLEIWEKTLGPDNPQTVMARLNLGADFAARRDFAGALAQYRTALDGMLKSTGPRHPFIGAVRGNIGNSLVGLDRFEDAEREYRSGRALLLELLPPGHPNIANIEMGLASCLLEQNRPDEALAMAQESWRRYTSQQGQAAPSPSAHLTLARTLWEAPPPGRDRKRAAELARAALEQLAGSDLEMERREVEAWMDERKIPRP